MKKNDKLEARRKKITLQTRLQVWVWFLITDMLYKERQKEKIDIDDVSEKASKNILSMIKQWEKDGRPE